MSHGLRFVFGRPFWSQWRRPNHAHCRWYVLRFSHAREQSFQRNAEEFCQRRQFVNAWVVPTRQPLIDIRLSDAPHPGKARFSPVRIQRRLDQLLQVFMEVMGNRHPSRKFMPVYVLARNRELHRHPHPGEHLLLSVHSSTGTLGCDEAPCVWHRHRCFQVHLGLEIGHRSEFPGWSFGPMASLARLSDTELT